ncbi:hypothetical protein [Streptomyces noursei]|uniref:hypothetical protein n=1 Tax=Streptomyces noursei TaxID=1971 RepID=UPI0035DBDA26
MSKVWFVTGSSRGLGRNFVEAALSRGGKVAATAQKAADLAELVAACGGAVLPIEPDSNRFTPIGSRPGAKGRTFQRRLTASPITKAAEIGPGFTMPPRREMRLVPPTRDFLAANRCP